MTAAKTGTNPVGLVIVTFNAAPHIARCLAAVASQTRRPDRVIVVDNASSDATLSVARSTAERVGLGVEFLAGHGNIGFAAANNRAVAALADCDLIATLNPDAFPEPGWLAALVDAAAARTDAASFASRLLLANDPTRLDGAGDVFHVSGLAWRARHAQATVEASETETPHHVFSACAAAALYRREDWIRAGGFDERFFCYAEDVDLGFRLQLMDRPCWYVPDAVCLHVGSASSGRESAFAIYHGHRNLEWTFVKNMPTRLLWRYLPLHLFASLSSVGWFTVRGATRSIVAAKWDAALQVWAVLGDRKRVQATKRISDAALLSRLDRSPLVRRLRDRRQQSLQP